MGSGVSRRVQRGSVAMGTFVSVEVVHREAVDAAGTADVDAAIDRALQWFVQVEAVCSRFDPRSELQRLAARAGEAVPVSALLFEAVRFALAVAEATGGAFDPTMGASMEARGIDREHRTGRRIQTAFATEGDVATYRDVRLDAEARTITLLQPLVLDLGAVAKGLAVDMAAAEVRAFENFAVYAGGDLYCGGVNHRGEPWSVGVRHPQAADRMIDVLRVSNLAVCTSGNYERPHLLDPSTRQSPQGCASVTVAAPTAMAADALATAAFVLGPIEGVAFLEEQGVEGMIVTPALDRRSTRGFGRYVQDAVAHARIAPA